VRLIPRLATVEQRFEPAVADLVQVGVDASRRAPRYGETPADSLTRLKCLPHCFRGKARYMT
jgi:hypothetical protein